MSKVLEVIKKRRSIRSFTDKPIPESVVHKLAEAIIWAPSAGNLQSRKFFFVYNKDTQKQIARAAWEQSFIAQAPLVIVGCADLDRAKPRYQERGTMLYAPQDVAVSVQNLMLVAAEEGLGTVWIGAFDEAEVSRILNLPDTLRPVVIVPVGYSDQDPKPRPRRPVEDIIREIK